MTRGGRWVGRVWWREGRWVQEGEKRGVGVRVEKGVRGMEKKKKKKQME